jgi:hypothetical protein
MRAKKPVYDIRLNETKFEINGTAIVAADLAWHEIAVNLLNLCEQFVSLVCQLQVPLYVFIESHVLRPIASTISTL